MSAASARPSPSGVSLPSIPVSVGELFDKKTILGIKATKIEQPQQRANVVKELALLSEACTVVSDGCSDPGALRALVGELQQINAALWDLENRVRQLSRDGNVGTDFVVAAQQIFSNNDQRARTKRAINELMNSPLIEEKLHA